MPCVVVWSGGAAQAVTEALGLWTLRSRCHTPSTFGWTSSSRPAGVACAPLWDWLGRVCEVHHSALNDVGHRNEQSS